MTFVQRWNRKPGTIYTLQKDEYKPEGITLFGLFESDRDFAVNGITISMDCVIPPNGFIGMKYRAKDTAFVRDKSSNRIADIRFPERRVIAGRYFDPETERPYHNLPDYWLDAIHGGQFYWNGDIYMFCDEFRDHGFTIEFTEDATNPFR